MAKEKKKKVEQVKGDEFIKMWVKCLEDGKDRQFLTEQCEKRWEYFRTKDDAYVAVTQKCYQLNAVIKKKTGKKLELPEGKGSGSHGSVSRFVQDNAESWDKFLK